VWCIALGKIDSYGRRMATIGEAIARNVRAERARLRWTQDDLAHRLGWSRPTVTAVESGRRQVLACELPALCRALDVSLSRLLLGTDSGELGPLRLSDLG
jgi:transcriptional regulator with XRE-family HTH domain